MTRSWESRAASLACRTAKDHSDTERSQRAAALHSVDVELHLNSQIFMMFNVLLLSYFLFILFFIYRSGQMDQASGL